MNIDEFQDLVDRCGERPEDWPNDIRSKAQDFLARSSEAQAIVAEAASLRTMFSGGTPERAPAHLADRIVTLAERMDEFRPTINRGLKHERVRFSERTRSGDAAHVEKSAETPAKGPSVTPKMYIWFGTVFLAGMALGVTGTVLVSGRHIDFATLFAVVT